MIAEIEVVPRNGGTVILKLQYYYYLRMIVYELPLIQSRGLVANQ